MLAVSLLLFMGVVFLSHQIISMSLLNQKMQQNYAEINDIKYGLFSVNQWKKKLATIINDEIARLSITSGDKEQIKPLLEIQLNKLIDNVNAKVNASNQKSFKGRVKQAFIDTFVDIKDIKKGIPKYADDIIAIMERPKTKTDIKGLILEKVGDYFDRTFEEQDLSKINTIIADLGVADLEAAKLELSRRVQALQDDIFLKTWVLIGLAMLIFIIAAFNRKALPSSQYIVMVLTLLALLIAGVTTPMINLEAKITEMSFVLFDHQIKFLNQILYFQSKSVLDVFRIMIAHPEVQMKIVGILMVAFSIAFPLLKLLSSLVYFYNFRGLQKNSLIQFFVLKSGKWSMTDVLIIAIFMAYIGFNGVISSQLDKLHSGEQELVLLATNGTSLQTGFYLFLAYAVLALFLSEFLTKPGAAKIED